MNSVSRVVVISFQHFIPHILLPITIFVFLTNKPGTQHELWRGVGGEMYE